MSPKGYATLVVAMVRDIPSLLRKRADRTRAQALGRVESSVTDGALREWARRDEALPLAWADFLDALAGALGGRR